MRVEFLTTSYEDQPSRCFRVHHSYGFAGIGWHIASMAIAAVDISLWDLKARLLNLPLVVLMGSVRDEIPVYGSGGFTSYSIAQLQEQLKR